MRTSCADAWANESGWFGAAEHLADQLDTAHPLSTMLQRFTVPTVRAVVAIGRKQPSRAEFRKIVAHPGVMGLSVTGALAQTRLSERET